MRFKWNTLLNKTLIIVLGSMLIFGLGLVYITSDEMLTDYEENIDIGNFQKLKSIKLEFENEMSKIEASVNTMSYDVLDKYDKYGQVCLDLEEELMTSFKRYLVSDDNVSNSVYVYFEPSGPNDICDVWMTYQEDVLMRHDKIPFERYRDHINMDWFYDVKVADQAYWVEPYKNRYNEVITSYVKPIKRNEEFIGIIGMYFSINTIRDVVSIHNESSSSFYWVANEDNQIIYHPLLIEGEVSDVAVDTILNETYFLTQVNDVNYRHYVTKTNNGWSFVYSTKDDLILGPRKVILRKVFISFLVFIFVLGSVMILAIKRYSEKINEIVAALKKAQRKDFSQLISIESGDEIGLLSQVVNDTLDSVSNNHIRLERMCYYSTSTGLPNFEKLKHDLNMYNDREIVLYLIDLDNFRTINDIIGKDNSDDYLREVSMKLKEAEDRQMYIYHINSDEFAFLQFNPDMATIADNAEFIINLLKQLAFSTKHNLSISASIGIAKYPDDVELSGGLIDCALIALESAKKEGKNNYKLFSRFIPEVEMNELMLIEDLKRAIIKNEFQMYYQPIFDRQDKPVMIEAYIRWHHPMEGVKEPKDFLKYIYNTGMITEFTQTVIQMTARDYHKQLKDVMLTDISINISLRQILSPLFISNLLSTLRQENLDVEQVHLEITEDILKYDLQTSIKKLNALKVLGMSITLDDFGSGDSSINTLKSIPIDRVKIDCSLTNQIVDNDHIKHFVSSIITMCHHLNYKVIAECVESKATYNALYEIGCDEFQGTYLHDVLPAENIQSTTKGSTM